ncbi:hypothetical protein [Streptomyces sp. NPDC050738]|uniref:hypothetical protein n=1 Tax=Streptomyces sp. NPDC050738 TaxID=3154744 RepID=UPI00343D93B0
MAKARPDPPPRIGYAEAMHSAHFVAAPLLTAAALSLAGVVAGADKQFLLPGPALLLLVITSMVLIASMQLSYDARQWLFTRQAMYDHLSGSYWRDNPQERDSKADEEFHAAQVLWVAGNTNAVRCYNAGTVLLGLGVAVALAPPDCGKQLAARWIATGIVALGTLLDARWMVRMWRQPS